LHGDSTGQGEETNVEANNNRRGGAERLVRHKIPLGILIFIVLERMKKEILGNNKLATSLVCQGLSNLSYNKQ